MKLTQVQTRSILWIGLFTLFGVAVLFGTMSKAAQAQRMLYIDFETTGASQTFPNKNFNYGEGGLSVDSRGKLTTTWGNIKTRY